VTRAVGLKKWQSTSARVGLSRAVPAAVVVVKMDSLSRVVLVRAVPASAVVAEKTPSLRA
jgi:hypothetical protein